MFKLRQLRVLKVHINAPSEASIEHIHDAQYNQMLHGDFLHINH